MPVAYGKDYKDKAKKYMKKFGLGEEEMYHTTTTALPPKYAVNGDMNFPNNHVYGGNV